MNTNIFKLTGFLYLLVILCAGASQGYIRGGLIVYNDVALSVANILENKSLFRLGITLDLIAFILDVIITILLYQIFKGYGKSLAIVMSAFRLVAHPAIGSINLLNHYYGLQLISKGNALNALDSSQSEILGMFFLDGHSFGYLIAGAFFGIHCVLLGVLICRSKIVSNLFGVLLIGAGIGYLIESFGNFNFPGYEFYTALIVGITAAIGEVSLTIHFLLKKNIVIEKN